MTVTARSAFDKDTMDLNGLTDPKIVAAMLDDDEEWRSLAVVSLRVLQVTKRSAAGGGHDVVVQICHIEPAVDDQDAKTIREMLNRNHTARTNRVPLPGMEDGMAPAEWNPGDDTTNLAR
jgi:hypothetical protein